jgi:hypothetical protein
MRFKTSLILFLSGSFFLFSGFFCLAQKKNLTLKLTYREPYCGGARPTKEIQAEAEKDRPYSKERIIMVSETGKVDSLKTEKSGILKLKLKPGNYKLYEPWRYYKTTTQGLNPKDANASCLKLEWEKEILQIAVTTKGCNIVRKTDILRYCPWAIPCILESAMPPMPQ